MGHIQKIEITFVIVSCYPREQGIRTLFLWYVERLGSPAVWKMSRPQCSSSRTRRLQDHKGSQLIKERTSHLAPCHTRAAFNLSLVTSPALSNISGSSKKPTVMLQDLFMNQVWKPTILFDIYWELIKSACISAKAFKSTLTIFRS